VFEPQPRWKRAAESEDAASTSARKTVFNQRVGNNYEPGEQPAFAAESWSAVSRVCYVLVFRNFANRRFPPADR